MTATPQKSRQLQQKGAYKLCRHEKVSVHAGFWAEHTETYSNFYPDPYQKKRRIYMREDALDARTRRVYMDFGMLCFRYAALKS